MIVALIFLLLPCPPQFELSYDYSPCERTITLYVSQIQEVTLGTPIYELPVEIGIVTDLGDEVYEIWIDEREQSFKLPSEEKPLMVKFDDGNWLARLWTFKKTKEELVFQSKYDDAIGREWAREQLGEVTGDR